TRRRRCGARDQAAAHRLIRPSRRRERAPRLTRQPVWVSCSPMSGGIRVLFNGVRGSTPCAGDPYARYGGHSSCVALESDGAPPVVFDLGTGLRPYGASCTGEFHGSVLLTHLHWD